MPRLIVAGTHETIRSSRPGIFLGTMNLGDCIAVVFYGKYKRSLTHHAPSEYPEKDRIYHLKEAGVKSFIEREASWISTDDELVKIEIAIGRKEGYQAAHFMKLKLLSLGVEVSIVNIKGKFVAKNSPDEKMKSKVLSLTEEYSEHTLNYIFYCDQNLLEILLKESVREGSSVPYLRYEDRWLKMAKPAKEMMEKFTVEYFMNEGAKRLAKQSKVGIKTAQKLLLDHRELLLSIGGQRRYPIMNSVEEIRHALLVKHLPPTSLNSYKIIQDEIDLKSDKGEAKHRAFPKRVSDSKEGEIIVPIRTNQANCYLDDLNFILGETPSGGKIVKKNSTSTKVSFPIFWMKQLDSAAIRELAEQLSIKPEQLRPK